MRLVVAVIVALTTATSASAVMKVPTSGAGSDTEAVVQLRLPAGLSETGRNLAVTTPDFTAPPEPAAINSDAAMPSSVVPDVMSWSLLLIGFGLVGLTARRRRRNNSVTA